LYYAYLGSRKILGSFSIVGAFLIFHACFSTATAAPSTDPWAASQTLQAAQLASELADKSKEQPTIVYVGFRTLFAGGHIPGASFHGTASTEEGLAELKKWTATLPRSTNLVIYCGCCPFEKCPNIRPAFTALHDLGFTRLRVLVLPASFAKDWVEKNYPYEKGS
jgi:thiosulfate/3-mercaptopyruvate sulfurtransferase